MSAFDSGSREAEQRLALTVRGRVAALDPLACLPAAHTGSPGLDGALSEFCLALEAELRSIAAALTELAGDRQAPGSPPDASSPDASSRDA